MNEHPINGMMELSLDKIRELANANTIVGTPISSPDGSTLIPISKLTVGFATGGADFGGHEKSQEKSDSTVVTDRKSNFGGGAGAGVNVIPIAFLILSPNGDPRLLPIGAPASTSIDRLIDLTPDILNRIQNLIGKLSSKKEKVEEKAL